MHPPRKEGRFGEALERLPEAPHHTELVDGVRLRDGHRARLNQDDGGGLTPEKPYSETGPSGVRD